MPDHDQTLVSIETDKEYPLASVGLLWLKPRDSVHTIGDFRRTLVSTFYDGMVNARFGEISQHPDAPFTFAQGGRGSFDRAYQLDAGVKEAASSRRRRRCSRRPNGSRASGSRRPNSTASVQT